MWQPPQPPDDTHDTPAGGQHQGLGKDGTHLARPQADTDQNLAHCQASHDEALNQRLMEKEVLKLLHFAHGVHRSYWLLWTQQSNGILRTLVHARRRRHQSG